MIGAIEAGGTKFVCALAGADGTVLAQDRIATRGPDETLAEVQAFFAQTAAAHGAIAVFGIASFGPIDIDPASPNYGRFTTTPKPGWQGARFHDVLGSFGAPIAVDTDVNCAALGEWALGAGRGCRTLAYTTVGTGIGSGVVHDGVSRAGFSHYESGHIHPQRDSATDSFAGICPYHGDCLEGLASGPAIERRWGRSLDRLGDEPGAVELIAGYLGHLAASLVLLHMPDRLIFGGGVMKAPGLIAAVRRATEARLAGYVVHPRLDTGLKRYIAQPALGDDAGISGAILLAQQALAATPPTA